MKKLYLALIIGMMLVATIFAGELMTRNHEVDKDIADELAKGNITEYVQSDIICNDKTCKMEIWGNSIQEVIEVSKENKTDEEIKIDIEKVINSKLEQHANELASISKSKESERIIINTGKVSIIGKEIPKEEPIEEVGILGEKG